MNTFTLWQTKLNQPISFFDKSIVEIVTNGDEADVPYCYDSMRSLLVWRNNWIPIFRLNPAHKTLVICHAPVTLDCPYLAVAALQSPEKITVNDRSFCQDTNLILPIWQDVSISAVKLGQTIVPIINPSLLLNERWLMNLPKKPAHIH